MTDVPDDTEFALGRIAADLLRHEADAVATMAERLDAARFEQVVEFLVSCSGNVATIGMGTSGIVARKVAATLTSTGTPALFVHPADALHGGLGAIGSQEIVIAVSNSGETAEVLALLPYLSGRGVPVIAIVGRLQSTLARSAAVALEAYAVREADRYDLVPTASVAVALAIGDALAIAVMETKGVTPESFAANHPSGRLGRRLTLRVSDVMHAGSELPSIPVGASLFEAVSSITSGGLGAVVILGKDGELTGIITDGDVRRTVQRCEPEEFTRLQAADVMTAEPVTVASATMAYDALQVMEDRCSQIPVLPVVDGPRCVGLLRLHDLVRIGL